MTLALVTLLIPLSYFLQSILEARKPNHHWPEYRYWRLSGVSFFMIAINNIVAFLARQLPQFHCFNIAELGEVNSAIIGFLLLSIGNADLHRAYHYFDFLWRHVHRWHHLPKRLDVAGVMFQTPWEGLANAILFALITTFVLGLTPVAAMICAFLAAFYGMFQHCNIKTPVWLGYFIQRPEAHCIHHQRDVHAWNYSDLPLWDMIFGTFKNPKNFNDELGFPPELTPQLPFLKRHMRVNQDVPRL
jgi:sterol desaturase/sphingolipid hydroxylase (fatty acid hydroxylase superfamily)